MKAELGGSIPCKIKTNPEIELSFTHSVEGLWRLKNVVVLFVLVKGRLLVDYYWEGRIFQNRELSVTSVVGINTEKERQQEAYTCSLFFIWNSVAQQWAFNQNVKSSCLWCVDQVWHSSKVARLLNRIWDKPYKQDGVENRNNENIVLLYTESLQFELCCTCMCVCPRACGMKSLTVSIAPNRAPATSCPHSSLSPPQIQALFSEQLKWLILTFFSSTSSNCIRAYTVMQYWTVPRSTTSEREWWERKWCKRSVWDAAKNKPSWKLPCSRVWCLGHGCPKNRPGTSLHPLQIPQPSPEKHTQQGSQISVWMALDPVHPQGETGGNEEWKEVPAYQRSGALSSEPHGYYSQRWLSTEFRRGAKIYFWIEAGRGGSVNRWVISAAGCQIKS